MCRVLPETNKDKTSELTKYAHGVVRIVKHDGTVKEGCMRNGAWFGMYREVKEEEVTIRINYPGELSSHVTFKSNDDGKLERKSESDPLGLIKEFDLVDKLLSNYIPAGEE